MAEENKGTASPSLSDTILAMDIADTIRSDERLRESALHDPERRKALKERMRQAYAAQGDVVDDAVLERAIEKMSEDRFVHKTMPAGLGRIAATAYVRRGLYASLVGVAVVVAGVGLGTVKYMGYAEEQRQIAAAAELKRQIDVVLPDRLEASAKYALSIVDQMRGYGMRDIGAVAVIEKHRDTARNALKVGGIELAKTTIDRLDDFAGELNGMVATEMATRQAEVDRKAAEARREQQRQAAKAMVAEADKEIDAIAFVDADRKAAAAIQSLAADVRSAAAMGERGRYEARLQDLRDLVTYIDLPYEITIVNRKGVKTGVEITHDQTGRKLYYIVVEAISPKGEAWPLEITDHLRGNKAKVATWAVHVPNATYMAVGRDKKDGVLDQTIAGEKPAGTLDIDWQIDEIDGQTINTW